MKILASLARTVLILGTLLIASASCDNKTGHYLECLQEDQCQVLKDRCCPAGFCCEKYILEDKKITSKCRSTEMVQGAEPFCKKFGLSPDRISDSSYFIRPIRIQIARFTKTPAVLNKIQDQFLAERGHDFIKQASIAENNRCLTSRAMVFHSMSFAAI